MYMYKPTRYELTIKVLKSRVIPMEANRSFKSSDYQ